MIIGGTFSAPVFRVSVVGWVYRGSIRLEECPEMGNHPAQDRMTKRMERDIAGQNAGPPTDGGARRVAEALDISRCATRLTQGS